MTILATIETVDRISLAIADHVANPRKAVRRICVEYGVSKSSFYRRLGTVSPLLPEAVVALDPEVSCPSGCGTILDLSGGDERIFYHWAWDCHPASFELKRDARKNLRELEKAAWELSTLPNSHSGTSATVDQGTDITSTAGMTSPVSTSYSTEPFTLTVPTNTNAIVTMQSCDAPVDRARDLFYSWKFDADGNVRPGWNYQAWTLDRVAGIRPFGTKDCTTITKPRRS